MTRHAKAILAIAAWVAAGSLAAADLPEVTPYRPSVSNPARLSAPGVLEGEFGWARHRDRSEETSATRFDYLFKYAFTEDIGILLGGDAYVAARDADGLRVSGVGDTDVILKLHRALSEQTAVGVEVGARLRTAKKGVGSEKTDYSVVGMASREAGAYEINLNVGVLRLGQAPAGESRTELGWALEVGRQIASKWDATVELSGNGREGTKATSEFLAAVAYKVSRRLVLDAGFSRGLSEGNSWTVFAGLTTMLTGH